MNPALADLLQHPERVTEIEEQEVRGFLLQVAGLLTALSARVGSLIQGTHLQETRVKGEDHLLTIPQVAEHLNVPKGYAYELARRGAIPTIRFGKYVRVSFSDLQEWTARHHEKGLDTGMYKMYSTSNFRTRHDRRGTPTNSKATRADSGGAGTAARRHIDDRRPVGAE